jgi:ABC-type nitrate/sulfonate/bicarbonate transport system substrate-binding protein
MNKFKVNRREFMLGAQTLAAGAMLSGAFKPAMAKDLTKVTYLTPFGFLIAFAPTMYAETSGIFAKHGLDVAIQGGRGSSMAVQQVVAANALVSRTGGTDLIKAYAKDPSIVAVAEIYKRDIFYVISAENAPIKKPEDMAGKTIGVVSASGATENILDMMLAARDIKAKEVERQVVGNAPAAFELVKRGRISGFIATSDTVFQLKKAGAPVEAWSTDDVAPCPGQVYITSKAQLEKSRETLAHFLAGVYDCLGAIIASKDLKQVVESMSQKYQVTEAKAPDHGLSVLDFNMDNFKRAYHEKMKSDQKSWQSAYSLMVKAGLIHEIDNPQFYDDSARQMAFS